MTVYVDDARIRYGRMRMHHMIADSTEELLEMADRIGVQRKWIQLAGTHREHADVCTTKRMLAVAAGAVEVSTRDLVRIVMARATRPTDGGSDAGE